MTFLPGTIFSLTLVTTPLKSGIITACLVNRLLMMYILVMGAVVFQTVIFIRHRLLPLVIARLEYLAPPNCSTHITSTPLTASFWQSTTTTEIAPGITSISGTGCLLSTSHRLVSIFTTCPNKSIPHASLQMTTVM
jgi:hypothetical protein